MIKFTFDAPKGQRIHKQFWAITVEGSLWHEHKSGKWVDSVDWDSGSGHSTHYEGIKSLKAFKRYVKKHPELKGRTVWIVSKYKDHHIKAEIF